MSDFSKAWQKLLTGVAPVVDLGIEEIAERLRDRAARSTLYKGTGELRKSIKVLPAGFLAREVLADKHYAGYVEFGNDPGGGYITPKSKKVLSFVQNGQRFFAKRVKAHGPMPFMTEASAETEKEANGLVEKHLASLLV